MSFKEDELTAKNIELVKILINLVDSIPSMSEDQRCELIQRLEDIKEEYENIKNTTVITYTGNTYSFTNHR